MSEKIGDFGGTIRFKELMEKLTKNLSDLSNLTISMMQKGQEALISDNEEILKKLEKDLSDIHQISYSVEESVQSNIALHHPFARDLRFILSTLKITNEIHRSAHDAVHIARSANFIDLSKHEMIIKKIGELAEKATSMFKESIKAFQNKKALNVQEWVKKDDAIDTLHNKIIDEVVEIMSTDSNWTRAGVSLILATRYIERIADHACNIVEESIWVVTSKRVKIE